MGATSTRVKTRGRRRGARQRAAAGSLPSFCPTLCLTPHFGLSLRYPVCRERLTRQHTVTDRVTARVSAKNFKPVTLAGTPQNVKEGVTWL